MGVAKASGKTTTEGKTRTAGETAAKSKTQTAKAEPVVKIVEVEKEKFLNISEIEPNVSQPRKMFDEEQLGELADPSAVTACCSRFWFRKRAIVMS